MSESNLSCPKSFQLIRARPSQCHFTIYWKKFLWLDSTSIYVYSIMNWTANSQGFIMKKNNAKLQSPQNGKITWSFYVRIFSIHVLCQKRLANKYEPIKRRESKAIVKPYWLADPLHWMIPIVVLIQSLPCSSIIGWWKHATGLHFRSPPPCILSSWWIPHCCWRFSWSHGNFWLMGGLFLLGHGLDCSCDETCIFHGINGGMNLYPICPM